jgi:hypothetical protein
LNPTHQSLTTQPSPEETSSDIGNKVPVLLANEFKLGGHYRAGKELVCEWGILPTAMRFAVASNPGNKDKCQSESVSAMHVLS